MHALGSSFNSILLVGACRSLDPRSLLGKKQKLTQDKISKLVKGVCASWNLAIWVNKKE